MMFWRANERGPRRFITPVWATTFSQTYVRKQKSKTNSGQSEHRFLCPASDFLLLSLSPVYFRQREANKHCEKMDPSDSTSSPLSSALPSRLSEHRLSPQISGQCNEPAAPQAAEITVEEANSSPPGIHIVAALQWDGLRQISS